MKQSASGAWIGPAVVLGCFAALLCAERLRPLRRRTEPAPRRQLRNLVLGAVSAATVAAVEAPVTKRVTRAVEARRWGLVPRLGLPAPAAALLTLALLDYTLYLWHVLLHRVPLLWRAHLVHHADLDLDATTAVRFQAAELLASVPWRAGQVVLIGVPQRLLRCWGLLTLAEVMFHHANLRLPPALEQRLSRWIVTPRLHGIHHSMCAAHQQANLSSGLTLWDRLHGSHRCDVPQRELTIGLPAYRRPEQVRLGWCLTRPLRGPVRDEERPVAGAR